MGAELSWKIGEETPENTARASPSAKVTTSPWGAPVFPGTLRAAPWDLLEDGARGQGWWQDARVRAERRGSGGGALNPENTLFTFAA